MIGHKQTKTKRSVQRCSDRDMYKRTEPQGIKQKQTETHREVPS